MQTPRHLAILLCAGAVALAGCGSSSTPSGGTSAGGGSAGTGTSIGGLSLSTKLSSPAAEGRLQKTIAAAAPGASAAAVQKAVRCYVQKLQSQGITTLGQAHGAVATSAAAAKACILSATGH